MHILLKVDYLNNSTIIIYFRICSCSYCQDLIQKFKIEWTGETTKRCKNWLENGDIFVLSGPFIIQIKCISFIVGADEQVLLYHTSSKDKLNSIICQRKLTLYMYVLFLFSLKCHFFFIYAIYLTIISQYLRTFSTPWIRIVINSIIDPWQSSTLRSIPT